MAISNTPIIHFILQVPFVLFNIAYYGINKELLKIQGRQRHLQKYASKRELTKKNMRPLIIEDKIKGRSEKIDGMFEKLQRKLFAQLDMSNIEANIVLYFHNWDQQKWEQANPLTSPLWVRKAILWLRLPRLYHWIMFYSYRIQMDADSYLKLSWFFKYKKEAYHCFSLGENAYQALRPGEDEEKNSYEYVDKIFYAIENAQDICRPRGKHINTPKIDMYIRSLYRFFSYPHQFVTHNAKVIQRYFYLKHLGFSSRQRRVIPNAYYYTNGSISHYNYGIHWLPDAIKNGTKNLSVVTESEFPLHKQIKGESYYSSIMDQDLYLITSDLNFGYLIIHSLVTVIYIIFYSGNLIYVSAADNMLAFSFYILACICIEPLLCPVYFTPLSIFVPKSFLSEENDIDDEKTFSKKNENPFDDSYRVENAESSKDAHSKMHIEVFNEGRVESSDKSLPKKNVAHPKKTLLSRFLQKPFYHMLVFLFSIPVGCFLGLLIYNNRFNMSLLALSIAFALVYVIQVLRSMVEPRPNKKEEKTVACKNKSKKSKKEAEAEEDEDIEPFVDMEVSGSFYLGMLSFCIFLSLSVASCFIGTVSQEICTFLPTQ